MFALYYYYSKYEGSGVVGVFMTIFIYAALLVLNAFIFYNYLVFLHMEGRLIDIYTRVTAETSQFFIPLDNEVSSRYLFWVITKAKAENAFTPGDIRRRAAVTFHTVTDPIGNYIKKLCHISIYRKSTRLDWIADRRGWETGAVQALCEDRGRSDMRAGRRNPVHGGRTPAAGTLAAAPSRVLGQRGALIFFQRGRGEAEDELLHEI